MQKSHASTKSVEDWITWATGEGYTDLEARPEKEGGVPKLYRTLCAKFLEAKSVCIKAH